MLNSIKNKMKAQIEKLLSLDLFGKIDSILGN